MEIDEEGRYPGKGGEENKQNVNQEESGRNHWREEGRERQELKGAGREHHIGRGSTVEFANKMFLQNVKMRKKETRRTGIVEKTTDGTEEKDTGKLKERMK